MDRAVAPHLEDRVTTGKEKIYLTQAQETLLITLYAKAVAPEALFSDPQAKAIIAQIDYDFAQLKVPLGTRLTVCMRAKQIDGYVRTFLAGHPDALVLQLGCGLDTRFSRVDNGRVTWYDLDLPDVIDLRRKFYVESERYQMIASSVTDLAWLDQISAQDRPVMVVAEGLLMYLHAADVKALVRRFQADFPGCHLVFDAFSELTASKISANPSIKKTGAVVHWGIDDPKALEAWQDGIHFKEEWFFTQSEDIPRLGLGNILMFKITGLFMVAKRAHRLLYYVLG
jgi:O-methyltransferase involved in polyketide biosynthesis